MRANALTRLSGHYSHVFINWLIFHNSKPLYTDDIFLQTVKTQLTCRIVRHFIKVYIVCKDKSDLQRKKVFFVCYSELQLNKANASDTEAAFLDLHLSISNDIVSTKIYDKRDDFDFEIVNFPFLDGDVPRSTSYGVYISQLIRFARASSYVADFNTRNKLLTQKLLKQGYGYHKLRKTFSKFYRRYYDLISKFQVGLKSLLRQGLSEPDFYGDLVYKLKKIVGSNIFSAQFIKIISHYKKIGYNINVLQQTACLVVNPITVGNFAFLFNCTPVGRTSDSMMVPT